MSLIFSVLNCKNQLKMLNNVVFVKLKRNFSEIKALLTGCFCTGNYQALGTRNARPKNYVGLWALGFGLCICPHRNIIHQVAPHDFIQLLRKNPSYHHSIATTCLGYDGRYSQSKNKQYNSIKFW